jgi:hypothetical protein
MMKGMRDQGQAGFHEAPDSQDRAGHEHDVGREEGRGTIVHRGLGLPVCAVAFSVLYAAEVARHPTFWLVVLAIGICAITAVIVIDRLHGSRARTNER